MNLEGEGGGGPMVLFVGLAGSGLNGKGSRGVSTFFGVEGWSSDFF